MRIIVVFWVLFFLLFVGCEVAYYQTDDVVTVTVTDKERIVTGNGESVSSKYLIFTDKETFQNTDLLFAGKFNSSDIQGMIRPGETYQFKVLGWRWPFLSMYRNVVQVKQIKS